MTKASEVLLPAENLALQLRDAKIPFLMEVVPLAGRKFRADFFFPVHALWVEVDGGTFARTGAKKCKLCGQIPQGAHNTGVGREKNCEKLNLATLAGYRVLVVTAEQVQSGQALGWIKQGVKDKGATGKVLPRVAYSLS